MPRVKLIVFTAAALLFAQLQCAVACLIQPCDTGPAQTESAPPCHRNHGHTPQRTPAGCPHRILVATGIPAQTLPEEIPLLLALDYPATNPAPLPAATPASELDRSAFSPPPFQNLSSVILRI